MNERTGNFQTDTIPSLRYEGGWAENAQDRGGETIFGVARRFHGTWPGWVIVDAAKTSPGFPANVNANVELKDLARDFYRAQFWDPIHGDELPWRAAAVLFDMAINSGVKSAVRQFQLALNGAPGPSVDVDGVVGPKTVKGAWDKGKAAIEEFLTARILFYTDIMVKDPTQRVWARNWVRRVIEMADYALEG